MAIVFDGYSRVYPASYYEDPSLTEFFYRIGLSLGEFAFNSTKYPHDYAFTLRMLRSWRLVDVGGAVLLAMLFTALRYVISVCFSLPVANWLQIQPASKLKWPESIWKFIAYSGLWLYSLYVVLLSGRYDFFHNPVDILRGIIFDGELLISLILTLSLPVSPSPSL
uniref:GPI ethanolamine phosphate transferase 2 n=1 Tax=Macrostomum lignano TaxID=282301 RepID=A0A1I8J2E8_9PLAT